MRLACNERFNSLVARMGAFLLLSWPHAARRWYVPRGKRNSIEFEATELTVMANTIARTMGIAAERDQFWTSHCISRRSKVKRARNSALQFDETPRSSRARLTSIGSSSRPTTPSSSRSRSKEGGSAGPSSSKAPTAT